MCGIAAVIGACSDDEIAAVQSMLEAMPGRGDRAPRLAVYKEGVLGCRRLAIVDREHGEQPFVEERTGASLIYNGELYNVQGLAAELMADGHRLDTTTDTEVVLKALLAYGAGAVEKFDGMFAFVFVNPENGAVVVGRDAYGIKPLYRGRLASGNIAFASEMKALVRVRCTEVEAVPCGEITLRKLKGDADTESIPRLLRGAVRDAVASMVDTDLPVAVLCSGGIDSSIVLYEAARAHSCVTAFTIGTDPTAPDVNAACRIADELGVPIEFVRTSADELLGSIPEVVRCIESFEPNHVRGGTLSFALSRAVHRAGIKVALCGEGADELFAGYPEFLLCLGAPDVPTALDRALSRFLSELHRTQLQRVDRTSMAWQLEVRVPYLRREVVQLAASMPPSHKLHVLPEGRAVNKWALREAYRGILPDWVVDRPKLVLSEGAGFGDNSESGIFVDHARRVMAGKSVAMESTVPINTIEELYYLSLFREALGVVPLTYERPHVNTLPTRYE